ncbi:MAG: N-acetylmuramoyl-L-alanine amidase [bacterium]|nr:N-acetylmuramoyl-L-alanine amidase [bacterium]
MAIVLVSAVLGPICSFAGAQSEVQVRIAARRVAAGGTEVALQPYEGGNHWGDLVLPAERFLSDDVEIGRWRYSSPVALQTLAGEQWVRIAARRVGTRGTEVALQQLGEGLGWGDRMLPTRRFLSSDVEIGRWRSSSPLTISPPVTLSPPLDAGESPAGAEEDTPRGLITPRGVPVAVLGRVGSGYLVRTPCGNTAEVSGGQPIYGAQIVLDPGHGGWWDTGAVGPNGLVERDLNLTLSRAIAKELADRDISAVLARTGSYGSLLSVRAALADDLRADAIISIHHNAPTGRRSSTPGTEVYVQSVSRSESRADSARLGGLLYEEITRALNGFPNISWGRHAGAGVLRVLLPDGHDAYGMIRHPNVPAVLIEYGFLSNPSEAALFATDGYISVAANATADAIEAYLTTDRPGTGFVSRPRVFDPASAPSLCEEVALE